MYLAEPSARFFLARLPSVDRYPCAPTSLDTLLLRAILTVSFFFYKKFKMLCKLYIPVTT